jgi:predicted HicB family RNase H-like nuclease
MKVLTVRMSDEQHKAIKTASHQEEVSMGQLIRQAIKEYLIQKEVKKEFDRR